MAEEEKAMVKAESREILDIQPDEVKRKLDAIHNFQAVIKSRLHEGHDYGVIPGTNKPTLLKPGAEKIAKLMNLRDDYEIVEKIENWEAGFFHYVVKCLLCEISSGLLISAGLGSCNSMESKYRWRWVFEDQLSKEQEAEKETLVFKEFRNKKGGKFRKYRLPNDDIFSQANTILKMAKKRALVDAALSAGRLSDLFTQDLEELKEEPIEIEAEPVAAPKKKITDKAKRIADLIFEMAGKNKEEAKKILSNYSLTCLDKKAESVKNLTESEVEKLFPEIEAAYQDWKTS